MSNLDPQLPHKQIGYCTVLSFTPFPVSRKEGPQEPKSLSSGTETSLGVPDVGYEHAPTDHKGRKSRGEKVFETIISVKMQLSAWGAVVDRR